VARSGESGLQSSNIPHQPSVGLYDCVSLSDCAVHCGKMANQIWMQFRMVGRMGPGMRHIVVFGEDRSTGGG